MANNLFDKVYNPDVLSCLANLSNDEVFTPPDVANKILDMLPQELFSNPNTTFLDPACKSGVFLREIAKRLIKGLEKEIPDLQERLDHIFHKQLYGIAITEMTSLLSRRSVYCSKYPNSKYSASKFDDVEGNIRYRNIAHTWVNGKCKYCGASKYEYGGAKRKGLETHAYEWIHTLTPEEIFNMKFDVIVGNPPYQLNTGTATAQAVPLYDKFVDMAKQLEPRYLSMIIPARWYAGGMGLDNFRKSMLTDKRNKILVDYPNAKDCFSGISIGGGVCYFLWERDYDGNCTFINIKNNKKTELERDLAEFDVFVRYNEAVNVIKKVKLNKENTIEELVSSLSPFGINSSERGGEKIFTGSVELISSKGKGYIDRKLVPKGETLIDKWQVLMSKVTSEHAGEPDKNGQFKVVSKVSLLKPQQVCTFSYFTIGNFDESLYAKNLLQYLCTKFVRFLLLQAISSINISKEKFKFVPQQDFSRTWTDEDLYKKYNLTSEEIEFIESMIKPMDLGSDANG